MNTTDKNLAALSRLYEEAVGAPPVAVAPMAGAGSGRRYYRLAGARALVGVAGTDLGENRAFVALSRHFRSKGLPVPEVAAVSADGMCYVQEDLGTTDLFGYIAPGRERGQWTAALRHALRRSVAALPAMQWRGAEGLDFGRTCYPVAAMDRQAIMWDLNYFKYCFMKPWGVEPPEALLERDFQALADRVLQHDSPTFMLRDCQSRNVMLAADGSPWFIDFQGGRRGPYHYDVASLLYQASARYPEELREELIDEYVSASRAYVALDGVRFRRELRVFALLRMLQVLGAYGLRGLVQRKPHFLRSISPALDNLRQLLGRDGGAVVDGLPCLADALRRVVEREPAGASREGAGLVVRVSSFGYRKSGIPVDDAANGGGFVFDCRALPNPGRCPEYATLTGRDREVAAYIEAREGMAAFLDHAYALVGQAVANYVERGFSDLMVSFGCTGGRHRSVYAAEHVARRLASDFGVEVVVNHTELGLTATYASRR